MPHASGIAGRRTGTQLRLAFDEHDVGESEARQVIRHTGAHAPAANDHDVRRAYLAAKQ
jgi:hypothetical protein